MAATYNFPKIKRGDTFRERQITVQVNDEPLDLTDSSICMQIKRRGYPKVEKDFAPVISDAENGVVTLPSFLVELGVGTYVYDLQITLNNGHTLTYLEGVFPVTQDVSSC